MKLRDGLVLLLAFTACSSSGGGNSSTGGVGGAATGEGSGGHAGSAGTGKGGSAGGAAGATGIAGSSGVAGSAGGAGTAGRAGSGGAGGASGGAGANGTAGAGGAGGGAGTTGGAGTAGAAGTNSAAGTSGAAGANGAAGTSGAAGANGAAGTSGAAGANGAAGTTGAAGSTGAAGTTGAAGAGAAGAGGASNGGNGGADSALCAASPGALVWGKSAAEAASTLTPVDVVMGQSEDVVAAAVVGGSTFAQYRWNASGQIKYSNHDYPGELTGTLFTSGLWINPVNDAVFYGMLRSVPMGANTEARLYWSSTGPDSTPLFSFYTSGTLATAAGEPNVGTFQVSGDSAGNLYGAFSMVGPQYLAAGDYGYSSAGTALGVGDTTLAQTLGPQDDLWTDPGGDLVLLKALTATTDLGCGPIVVPSAGGVALAKLTWGGACLFSKLLTLPTAAVQKTNFRAAADGSLLVAVVYAGTINFGGGLLASSGPNALALARFDGDGSLLWSKSFGSGTSSFTLGSLGAGAAGTVILTGGYTGGVDLGGGQLPGSNDTFLVTFDPTGQYRWGRTVSVGPSHRLVATAGKCALVIATDSPTVDFGQGPYFVPLTGYSWLVAAALGL